ncbi:hypothetical protein [Phormidium tenue]|uniref:hypothetical protein n=1 Tax=Phormidium tenue TaxID=126344 RepID=UPI00168795B9|nr:hypothetical protein [Phormidium tenue]
MKKERKNIEVLQSCKIELLISFFSLHSSAFLTMFDLRDRTVGAKHSRRNLPICR